MCQKTKDSDFHQTPTLGGDDGGRRRRIFRRPPPPYHIAPRDEISRSGILRSWKYKSQENRCRSALSGVGAIMSCLPREVAAVMNDLSRELGALHEPPSREFVAIPNHLSRELVGNAVWDQQLIHLGVRSHSLLNDLTRSSRTARFVRLEPYSEPPSREFRAISLGSSRPCRSHPLVRCE